MSTSWAFFLPGDEPHIHEHASTEDGDEDQPKDGCGAYSESDIGDNFRRLAHAILSAA